MGNEQSNLKTFQEWERQAHDETNASRLAEPDDAEVRHQWDCIRDKNAYITLLRLVQNRQRDVGAAYSERVAVGSESILAERSVERALQKVIDAQTALIAALRNFLAEQEVQNDNGDVNASEWSRYYTKRLIDGARYAMLVAQREIDTCRETCRELECAAALAARLKSPRLVYVAGDRSTHSEVNKADDAGKMVNPPTNTARVTDPLQADDQPTPSTAGRLSGQQKAHARSPRRSPRGHSRATPKRPTLGPGEQGSAPGRLQARPRTPTVAPSAGNQQDPGDNGAQIPPASTISAIAGAQAAGCFDEAYDLSPGALEAPCPAPLKIESDSNEHTDNDNSPVEDSHDDAGHRIHNNDAEGQNTDLLGGLEQALASTPEDQCGGPVEDGSHRPQATSNNNRRGAPRNEQAGDRNAGVAPGGKKRGGGVAAAPGAPGGDASGSDSSNNSRKRQSGDNDKNPGRPKRNRRSAHGSSNGGSSIPDDNFPGQPGPDDDSVLPKVVPPFSAGSGAVLRPGHLHQQTSPRESLRSSVARRLDEEAARQADPGTWNLNSLSEPQQSQSPRAVDQPPLESHEVPFPRGGATIDKVQAAQDLGFDGTLDSFRNEGHWEFQATLGEGGFGLVTLWIQRNADGYIIDEVAVKDSYLGQHDWDNPAYWSQPDDPREAREASIHKMLSDLPGWTFVQHFGSRVYPERYMVRIYMEYCQWFTLEDLIRRHRTYDSVVGQGVDNIPRLAIWSISETLAQAACLLKNGTLPGLQIPSGWQGAIVHRDLKPSNILLDINNGARWPDIPVTFKVGDFGLAMPENTDGLRNPEDLIGAGTVGYMAPEQMIYADLGVSNRRSLRDPVMSNRHKLGSPTNVFAIGRIMLSLMTLTDDDQAAALQARYDLTSEGSVDIPDQVWTDFSSRLVTLVRRCLEPHPDRRIGAEQLLREVTDIVQQYPFDFGSVPTVFERLPENAPFYYKDRYTNFAR